MSKKKPCGLDYCPQEEIIGIYASCTACAWGKYDAKDNKKRMDHRVAGEKVSETINLMNDNENKE